MTPKTKPALKGFVGPRLIWPAISAILFGAQQCGGGAKNGLFQKNGNVNHGLPATYEQKQQNETHTGGQQITKGSVVTNDSLNEPVVIGPGERPLSSPMHRSGSLTPIAIVVPQQRPQSGGGTLQQQPTVQSNAVATGGGVPPTQGTGPGVKPPVAPKPGTKGVPKSNTLAGGPGAPPPPMPGTGAPPIPEGGLPTPTPVAATLPALGRNDLLESIRSGTKLKEVPTKKVESKPLSVQEELQRRFSARQAV